MRKSKISSQFFDDHEHSKIHAHAMERLKPNKLQSLLGASKIVAKPISQLSAATSSDGLALVPQDDPVDAEMILTQPQTICQAGAVDLHSGDVGGDSNVSTSVGHVGAIDPESGKPMSYVQRWINTLMTVYLGLWHFLTHSEWQQSMFAHHLLGQNVLGEHDSIDCFREMKEGLHAWTREHQLER